MGHLRVHFVRRISADHMLDGHVASGVEFDPGIQSEHFAVDNDDEFVLGNHAFDLTSRQDIVPGPGGDGHLAHLGWLTEDTGDNCFFPSEI